MMKTRRNLRQTSFQNGQLRRVEVFPHPGHGHFLWEFPLPSVRGDIVDSSTLRHAMSGHDASDSLEVQEVIGLTVPGLEGITPTPPGVLDHPLHHHVLRPMGDLVRQEEGPGSQFGVALHPGQAGF